MLDSEDHPSRLIRMASWGVVIGGAILTRDVFATVVAAAWIFWIGKLSAHWNSSWRMQRMTRHIVLGLIGAVLLMVIPRHFNASSFNTLRLLGSCLGGLVAIDAALWYILRDYRLANDEFRPKPKEMTVVGTRYFRYSVVKSWESEMDASTKARRRLRNSVVVAASVALVPWFIPHP